MRRLRLQTRRAETQQKQRAGDERARASGGKLRSQPTEGSPPPMASNGGLATKRNTRSSLNSRSSNSGRQARRSSEKK